ncbi:serine protease inhibitor Kazal-type 2-like, partial [Hippopotamus amphibius kiboko]|uniref:serine protease inhibitor Kazal-type 2-like n=1 Tax=Hippopotamus amphibius kiboko TaxID=575201 RepID=UPI0025988A75
MSLEALPLLLLLVWWDSTAPLNAQCGQHSEYRTPNCDQYKLPGCPRDFNPMCGSDMSTYPNEYTLCMKIREEKEIKG